MIDEDNEERRHILEMTYEKTCNQYERQQKELHNRHETALKTICLTVILIGIIATITYRFRQFIQSYAAQPVSFAPTEVLGAILIALSATLLATSPLFALSSLTKAYNSEDTKPQSLIDISNQQLLVKRENKMLNPGSSVEDWYKYLIYEQSKYINRNNNALRSSERYLRASHTALVVSTGMFTAGLWLSSM